MRFLMLVMAGALTLGTLAGSARAGSHEEFGAHWYDGQAELDGYRLQISRYGEVREGHAVMIFVTEPFSESRRVKPNDHRANPGDTFDALKLNLVRDFQTGIYDYNTMVSVFTRSGDFSPVKVTFSSAEWCGHVFEEMIVNPRRITGTTHSYFEGESGPIDLPVPEGGVLEDNLFILLRGLRGDFLAPGEIRTVPYLPGSLFARLAHQPHAWGTAALQRLEGTRTVEVPAGSFEVRVFTIRTGDGRDGEFLIEDAYPHRIVKWRLAPDVSGELTGTLRTPYWNLNHNGEERYLRELGLE